MGGTESPDSSAQTTTQSPKTPQREPQLQSRPSPEKWNLAAMESGPGHMGEVDLKPNLSPAVISLRQHWETPTSPARGPTSPSDRKDSEKDEFVTYPEGGVQAWLVVLGTWCAIFAALGTANSFGSFQSYFITHQLSKFSPGSVGWIFSMYAFLAFAGGIFVGPIFDKYGPKWLILVGSIGVCSSMFLVGLCQHYWQFLLVFGFLGGGGSCLLYTPAVASVGHYFSKKRGNAIGIALSSSAIGGVVLPLMLQSLIPKVGFAWSTRMIGCIYVCTSVIACTLIRSRLPPAKDANAKPDFSIFEEKAFAITVVGVYLLQWAYFVPLSYISSYALFHGYSTAFSSNVLVFQNIGSIFGRWLPGFTGDKIGRYNSIIVMTFATIVSVLGVWLPVGQTRAGLVVFAFTFGFTSGSILTLTAACIGQLCETKNYGRYYATAYTIASIGYLTGIPIGGELIDLNHGQYWGLILFVGLCYVGAVVALVVVRVLQAGWKIMVIY
ncbi:unnamed protein product [Calypogeia fissa]